MKVWETHKICSDIQAASSIRDELLKNGKEAKIRKRRARGVFDVKVCVGEVKKDEHAE